MSPHLLLSMFAVVVLAPVAHGEQISDELNAQEPRNSDGTVHETTFMRILDARQNDDWAEVARLTVNAAEQGDPYFQNDLALQYEVGGLDGLSEFFKKDLLKAIYWYEKAAAQGETSAQVSLGKIYLDGNEAVKDITKAIALLTEAANKLESTDPNATTFQRALYKLENTAPISAHIELGRIYRDGIGVARDMKNAVEWYKRAADHGSSTAAYELGLIFYRGEDIVQDYQQAAYYLAQADSDLALFYLAMMYHDGKGVPQDYATVLVQREVENGRFWLMSHSALRAGVF